MPFSALVPALLFFLPLLQQLDDGLLHLQGRVASGKYLRRVSRLSVMRSCSSFFSSDMMERMASCVHFPSRLSFLSRCAWESEGVFWE